MSLDGKILENKKFLGQIILDKLPKNPFSLEKFRRITLIKLKNGNFFKQLSPDKKKEVIEILNNAEIVYEFEEESIPLRLKHGQLDKDSYSSVDYRFIRFEFNYKQFKLSIISETVRLDGDESWLSYKEETSFGGDSIDLLRDRQLITVLYQGNLTPQEMFIYIYQIVNVLVYLKDPYLFDDEQDLRLLSWNRSGLDYEEVVEMLDLFDP